VKPYKAHRLSAVPNRSRRSSNVQ